MNTRKTKEIVIGPLTRNPPTQIVIIGDWTVDRLLQFTLLAVTVNEVLKWNDHVASVCSKTNKRVYFLKQLKRAGISTSDLLCFYKAVVRPVAEYACHVRHFSPIVDQSNRIESIQRRVMKIIFTDCALWCDCTDACQLANVPSPVDRREQLTRRFFSRIYDANNCLNYLLPEQRDSRITAKMYTPYRLPKQLVLKTRLFFML